MLFRSEPVVSRQTAPHPRLAETVLKHRDHPWRKPVAEHSQRAFADLLPRVESWGGPLMLDTGCGTGMSTAVLAKRSPECLVVGVDKSEDRLGRQPELPPNAVLVRMDLEDFWLLARAAGLSFSRQTFFYPNPWPKAEHRLRRWPFHPIWPTALACGGVWELRTNWQVYALEFAEAYRLLTGDEAPVEVWQPPEPETLFEKKYLLSGHTLWRWVSPTESSRSQPLPD